MDHRREARRINSGSASLVLRKHNKTEEVLKNPQVQIATGIFPKQSVTSQQCRGFFMSVLSCPLLTVKVDNSREKLGCTLLSSKFHLRGCEQVGRPQKGVMRKIVVIFQLARHTELLISLNCLNNFWVFYCGWGFVCFLVCLLLTLKVSLVWVKFLRA